MATARVDASAAPKTPHPNGKTKNQSSTTLTNAETTLHHMARRGAPSRRNDRTAGSDHQSEACEDHQQRNADVDGGDAVAADPMADKNAVGDRDGRDAEHAQQRGDEKLAEQAAYMFRPEVQCVSFHKPKLLLFTGGHKKGRTSVVVLPSHLIRPYSDPPMRITKLLCISVRI